MARTTRTVRTTRTTDTTNLKIAMAECANYRIGHKCISGNDCKYSLNKPCKYFDSMLTYYKQSMKGKQHVSI